MNGKWWEPKIIGDDLRRVSYGVNLQSWIDENNNTLGKFTNKDENDWDEKNWLIKDLKEIMFFEE